MRADADAPDSRQPGSAAQMPTVFAAQGALPLVDHPRWTAELAAWDASWPPAQGRGADLRDRPAALPRPGAWSAGSAAIKR
jgi:hypothetical protein